MKKKISYERLSEKGEQQLRETNRISYTLNKVLGKKKLNFFGHSLKKLTSFRKVQLLNKILQCI